MTLPTEPIWSPDDHLQRVYRRGRQLRRRRQAGAVAGALAAILAVVGVARGLSGDNGGRRIATSPGSTALSTTTSAPTPPETTAATDTITAPTIATGPTSSVRRTTTTTRVLPPPTTASTPTTAFAAPCPVSVLKLQTSTDHPSYGPGQKVVVGLVVTNQSGQPCTGPGPCGITPAASAFGPTPGTLAWHQNAIAIACVMNPPPPPLIPPHASHAYPDVAEWDRTGATAPGPYQAVVYWLGVTAGAAPFTLTG